MKGHCNERALQVLSENSIYIRKMHRKIYAFEWWDVVQNYNLVSKLRFLFGKFFWGVDLTWNYLFLYSLCGTRLVLLFVKA